MKAVVFHLGCKTNGYESDAMAEQLRAAGFEVSADLVPADVYVVNTCAVTAEAERKSRQALSRMKKQNPKARIYVCGCASENNPSAFLKDGVALVIGSAEKARLVENILADVRDARCEIAEVPKEYEEFPLPPSVDRTRATLKIQDGCNNFCSYCVIPILRGRSRSRSVESILREAEYLDGKTHEIVLTGINLSAYGKDIGINLPSLVLRLDGINARIRLGSFYVEGVTDVLLDALKRLKNFCPHFHLSLQSGDDEVLRAMNRKYTTADYKAAVAKIRKEFPTAGITTDVITGYPTESGDNAQNTLRFLKEVSFSDIHVFVFSKRPNTAAAKLKELPDAVKEARKQQLLALKAELQQAFAKKNLSIPQEILVEDSKNGEFVGYSKNYLRIYTSRAEPLQSVIPKILYKDGIK